VVGRSRRPADGSTASATGARRVQMHLYRLLVLPYDVGRT
jgi:hypothetical protein